MQRVVPGEAALGVGEEVQAGRPAAAHQHGVAGYAAGKSRLAAADPVDAERLHPQATRGRGGGPTDQGLDAEGAGALGEVGVDGRADIDDDGGLRPRLGEVEGGVPGGIVRGDDGGPVPDPHAIAVEVGLGGARQHDAGPVVAVEDQRLLERALGEDDLTGADLPQPLARRARGGRREVVGQALAEADEVLVVVADRRRPGHHGDVREPRELGEGLGRASPRQACRR